MQVDFQRATEICALMPVSLRIPTLSPEYVVADALRDNSLEPTFWHYQEDGKHFLHGFHVSPIPGTEYIDIQSPYGYGGGVSNSEDGAFLDGAWRDYTNWCLERRVVAEFLRFHPIAKNERFYRGQVLLNRETVWINLETENLLGSYAERMRTAIRKAKNKGLVVQWCAPEVFLELFPRLYYQAMESVGADDFYFFKDAYFERLCRLPQARLAICSREGAILSAAVFLVGGDIIEYHLGAALPEGKAAGAPKLVFHEAAIVGASLGCKVLYLGGGTNNQPDNPLFFFKARFSALRASFSIGKQIHLPQAYDMLKTHFAEAYAEKAGQILFYR